MAKTEFSISLGIITKKFKEGLKSIETSLKGFNSRLNKTFSDKGNKTSDFTKSFTTSVNRINNSFKKIGNSFKSFTTSSRGFNTNVFRIRNSIKSLNSSFKSFSSLKNFNTNIKRISTSLKGLGTTFKTFTSVRSFSESLIRFESALRNVGSSFTKFTASGRKFGSSFRNIGETFKNFQNPVKNFSGAFKNFVSSLKNSGNIVRGFRNTFNNLGSSFQNIFTSTKRFGTGISNTFRSIGNSTRSLSSITERSFSRFGSSFNNRLRSINTSARKFREGLNDIEKSIIGFFAIDKAIDFGKSIIEVGSTFENQMARVKAVSNATETEMKALRQEAERLGASTMYSATEAGQALENLLRNGMATSEAIEALEGVLMLAGSQAIDLSKAADIATTTLNGFGLKAKDLTKVVDLLAKGASSSTTDVVGLADGFKDVAPIAQQLGASLEEVIAAITVLVNRGFKGAAAGTALRAMFSRLIKPTTGAEEILNKYGITMSESEIKAKGLSNALKKLSDVGLSLAELKILFGEEHYSAAGGLLTDFDKFTSTKKELGASEGTAKRQYEQGTGEYQRATKELESTWEDLMIKMFEKTKLILNDVVSMIHSVVDEIKKASTWIAGGLLIGGNAIGRSFRKASKEIEQERAGALAKNYVTSLASLINRDLFDGNSNKRDIDELEKINNKRADLHQTLEDLYDRLNDSDKELLDNVLQESKEYEESLQRRIDLLRELKTANENLGNQPLRPEREDKPEKPERPLRPTAPVKPGAPFKPQAPTKPIAPTRPIAPVRPIRPIKPTGPVAPTKPQPPTRPIRPMRPTAPTEPTKPQPPTRPIRPFRPTEPVAPTKPQAPVRPMRPMRPTGPTEPSKPQAPFRPIRPVKPTPPPAPLEPVRPVKPEYVAEPRKPELEKLRPRPKSPQLPRYIEERYTDDDIDNILTQIGNVLKVGGKDARTVGEALKKVHLDGKIYTNEYTGTDGVTQETLTESDILEGGGMLSEVIGHTLEGIGKGANWIAEHTTKKGKERKALREKVKAEIAERNKLAKDAYEKEVREYPGRVKIYEEDDAQWLKEKAERDALIPNYEKAVKEWEIKHAQWEAEDKPKNEEKKQAYEADVKRYETEIADYNKRKSTYLEDLKKFEEKELPKFQEASDVYEQEVDQFNEDLDKYKKDTLPEYLNEKAKYEKALSNFQENELKKFEEDSEIFEKEAQRYNQELDTYKKETYPKYLEEKAKYEEELQKYNENQLKGYDEDSSVFEREVEQYNKDLKTYKEETYPKYLEEKAKYEEALKAYNDNDLKAFESDVETFEEEEKRFNESLRKYKEDLAVFEAEQAKFQQDYEKFEKNELKSYYDSLASHEDDIAKYEEALEQHSKNLEEYGEAQGKYNSEFKEYEAEIEDYKKELEKYKKTYKDYEDEMIKYEQDRKDYEAEMESYMKADDKYREDYKTYEEDLQKYNTEGLQEHQRKLDEYQKELEKYHDKLLKIRDTEREITSEERIGERKAHSFERLSGSTRGELLDEDLDELIEVSNQSLNDLKTGEEVVGRFFDSIKRGVASLGSYIWEAVGGWIGIITGLASAAGKVIWDHITRHKKFIDEVRESYKEVQKSNASMKSNVLSLIGVMRDMSRESTAWKQALSKLSSEYPELLKRMDLERIHLQMNQKEYEKLRDRIKEVIEEQKNYNLQEHKRQSIDRLIEGYQTNTDKYAERLVKMLTDSTNKDGDLVTKEAASIIVTQIRSDILEMLRGGASREDIDKYLISNLVPNYTLKGGKTNQFLFEQNLKNAVGSGFYDEFVPYRKEISSIESLIPTESSISMEKVRNIVSEFMETASYRAREIERTEGAKGKTKEEIDSMIVSSNASVLEELVQKLNEYTTYVNGEQKYGLPLDYAKGLKEFQQFVASSKTEEEKSKQKKVVDTTGTTIIVEDNSDSEQPEKTPKQLFDETKKFIDALKKSGIIDENEYRERLINAYDTYISSLESEQKTGDKDIETLKTLMSERDKVKKELEKSQKAEEDFNKATEEFTKVREESAQADIDRMFEAEKLSKDLSKTKDNKGRRGSGYIWDKFNFSDKFEKDLINMEFDFQKLDQYLQELQSIGGDKFDVLDKIEELSELGQKSGAQELIKQLQILLDELEKAEKAATDLDSAIQLKKAQKEIKEMQSESSKMIYDTVKNGVQGLDSLANSWISLFENFSDMNFGEQFSGIVNTVFSTIDTVMSFLESLKQVTEFMELLGLKKEALAAIEQTTSGATIAAIQAEAGAVVAAEAEKTAAITGALATQASANLVAKAAQTSAATTAMAAESTAAYASIPFAGVGLAAAQIAEMQALIAATAALPMFAEGGIVGGSKYYGDQNLARVNSGEMILNRTQQSRLWGIVNGGSRNNSSIGKVEFEITGQKLRGVLKNYDNKMGKLS